MKSDTAERHSAGVYRALEHILVNRDDSTTTIQKLSRVAHFAPFHFRRVFRSVTGQSVQRYIRTLRLDYSVNQLLFTDDTILNIALQAGYQSHEAFTRAFQQSLGVAPSTLRVVFAARRSSGANDRRLPALSSHLANRHLSLVNVQHGSLRKAKVIFRSYFGPYVDVPECWRQLYAQASALGLSPRHMRPVGIMYDHPLACERVRYDACLTVSPDFRYSPDFAMQIVRDRLCTLTAHRGPYSLTPYTYVRLVNQCTIQEAGSITPLPYYEVYHECPPTAGQDVHADIFVPLAKPAEVNGRATPRCSSGE